MRTQRIIESLRTDQPDFRLQHTEALAEVEFARILLAGGRAGEVLRQLESAEKLIPADGTDEDSIEFRSRIARGSETPIARTGIPGLR